MNNEISNNQDRKGSGLKQSSDKALSVSARYGRIIFTVLTAVFAACVVVQVFLAGMAIFIDPLNWGMHSIFVRYFTFLPILMLIFSFIGRLPRDMLGGSLAMFVMFIAEYITATFSANFPLLSALHPVIALMLFGASTTTIKKAWPLVFGS